MTTSVENKINICSNEIIEELDKAPEIYFSGLTGNWFEVQTGRPEGYRVPTRSELLNALDKGQLDDFLNLPLPIFWTISESTYNYDYSWAVNLNTGGKVEQYSQMLEFQVIYIKE